MDENMPIARDFTSLALNSLTGNCRSLKNANKLNPFVTEHDEYFGDFHGGCKLYVVRNKDGVPVFLKSVSPGRDGEPDAVFEYVVIATRKQAFGGTEYTVYTVICTKLNRLTEFYFSNKD